MRIVLQRVRRASVTVDDAIVSAIGPGLLLLVGITVDDTEDDVSAAVSKIAGLRIFPDEEGLMNRSVTETAGEVLVVSQFTLYGDATRGRRPSFTDAARPEVARPLIDATVDGFRDLGLTTQSGVFGASMQVDLINDGPVTLVIDVKQGKVSAPGRP
ncbi:MAG: D-tyrosyl-tRNA(Tyr) deacylase [Acidimicrobiia bacterium]|nr:D-tyrosyl-tRNA(Tyr) deacylase [Acidimicrobiia bacterium]